MMQGGAISVSSLMSDPIDPLKRQLGELVARASDGWPRADMAYTLGTQLARISDLRHGKLERFSLETLIRYADRMQYDVALTVSRRLVGRRGSRSS